MIMTQIFVVDCMLFVLHLNNAKSLISIICIMGARVPLSVFANACFSARF